MQLKAIDPFEMVDQLIHIVSKLKCGNSAILDHKGFLAQIDRIGQ